MPDAESYAGKKIKYKEQKNNKQKSTQIKKT